jgi:hypothetical protein
MAKNKKSLKRHVAHAAGWQVAKRVAKMVPFGGTAVAVVLVGTDIKNKGLVKGVINSGIDAIPVVGLVKNGIEIVRGKDFLPDKEEKKNGSKA